MLRHYLYVRHPASLLLALTASASCVDGASSNVTEGSTTDTSSGSEGAGTVMDSGSTGATSQPGTTDVGESSTGAVDETGGDTTGDTEGPEELGPLSFGLLIERDGAASSSTEWTLFRAIDGVTDGPTLIHEDVEGRSWTSAAGLSGQRVVLRSFGPRPEKAQIRIASVAGDLPAATMQVDELDGSFIVSPADESLLYVRNGVLYRQELDGLSLGDQVGVTSVYAEPGPFPAIADPQGRYVVAITPGQQLARVSLMNGSEDEFTGFNLTGSVELPELTPSGNDGFFVEQADDMSPPQLMHVDLEATEPVVQVLVDSVGGTSDPLLDGAVRPHPDAPGVVALVGSSGGRAIQYIGIDGDGSAMDTLPLHGPDVTAAPFAIQAHAWSNDGRWLVFAVSLSPTLSQNFLAEFGDGHAPNLVALGNPVAPIGSSFIWSPTNETLHFAWQSPVTLETTLETIELSDDGPQWLDSVELPVQFLQFQDVRDDGDELLLTASPAREGNALFSVDVSSGQWGELTQLSNSLRTGEAIVSPAYGPDERVVAYGRRTGAFGIDLSIMVAFPARPGEPEEVVGELQASTDPVWTFMPAR
ncbi:MAG: hypothetical protein AAGA54_32120 [Myxococcota bacterium]